MMYRQRHVWYLVVPIAKLSVLLVFVLLVIFVAFEAQGVPLKDQRQLKYLQITSQQHSGHVYRRHVVTVHASIIASNT